MGVEQLTTDADEALIADDGVLLVEGEEDVPIVPIKPVKLPSVANTFPNGQAPASLLRGWPGDQGMKMLVLPSYGMQALHLYAAENGWQMRTTGRGRTYAQQEALFRSRYQTTPIAGQPYKMWDGNGDGTAERWYQKPGTAQAAVPGKSNHGYWCADDMALELDGDSGVESVTNAFVTWAINVAHLFGWAWDLQSELWHVHWIAGDTLPPAAVAVLERYGVLDPPGDDDMTPEIPPRRLLDTRTLGGKVSVGQVVEIGTPAGKAVGVNITVTESDGGGFVTAWGAGNQPATSNVNYDHWQQTIANYAMVPVDNDHEDGPRIRLTCGGSGAHVIVDLQGTFG